MRASLRRGLVMVSVLALASFAAATAGVVALARDSEALRNERGADLAREDAERLAESSPPAATGAEDRPRRRRLSGFVRADLSDVGPPPSPRIRAARDAVLRECAARGAPVAAVREVSRRFGAEEDGAARLAVAAAPARGGGYAWSARMVVVPQGMQGWRLAVAAMAASTLLALLAALRTLRQAERGAAALQGAFASLAEDLSAPVPRPDLAELARLAEAVSAMAAALRSARDAGAALQRELTAKERLASLGRVVAGVAHELRNPLASIKLRVDLARMQGAATSPEDLAEIAEEISRLDRLVADLLTVSGRRPGPRARADLGALVAQRASWMAPWAQTLGVTLRASGRAEAVVDADAVGRAVDNLLRNAAEASPRGGSVRAKVASVGGRVEVTVEDDGDGVPEDRAAELFEPFFTTRPEGTGLGLALTRAVAESHGGSVRYARDRGVTRFTLEMPGT